MTEEREINSIVVQDRHRAEVGDLANLKASIAGVGLLHPIVITASGRLVAGLRRLKACKELGWANVPVRVADSLTTASLLLEAERDENICRLDMKPGEKAALGRALEELERPKAAARRRATQNNPSSENFTEQGTNSRAGDTRELVGKAVGMSGVTYGRAKAVLEAAETGDPDAVEALREMNETGKVTPAFEKVTGKKTKIHAPRGGKRKKTLKEVLDPLHSYLKTWDEQSLSGVMPAEAKRLLKVVQAIDQTLFEVERALEARTVVSRALR